MQSYRLPKKNRAEKPHWRGRHEYHARELAPALRSWLLDEGSLTERLIRRSGNRFRVVVLHQRWQKPRSWEREALGMHSSALALVREVLLECAGAPWVYARSILPATSLRGELRHLRRFGARSLGATLFASKGLERGEIEIALLDADMLPLPVAIRGCAPLWARRSVFRVRGKPILVAEVFLPACPL